MTKGFYPGTGNRTINYEQGMPQKPEPNERILAKGCGPVMFVYQEPEPFIVPPQEYDAEAFRDAERAFFSERGNPIDTFSGPARYEHGSDRQILAACLAYHAAVSKRDAP